MNPIAVELNTILKGSTAERLLSDFGTRYFFPKGIVSQSAEAKKKAHKFNATVGMATDGKKPLFLDSIQKLVPGLTEEEIFPYAPGGGLPGLRDVWRTEMDKKNPSLRGKSTSYPMVTSGLTHGIMVTADLFVDPKDEVVVPDMFWGNYRLIFEERKSAELKTFPFFTKEGGLNIDELEKALRRTKGNKKIFILNFPNNPTGYSPTAKEAEDVVKMVHTLAEEGNDLLCIIDDAYFGLFYEEETYKESLFGQLADLHERVLAVKTDGATKEELAWGFRVGFLTYAAKGMTEEQYGALEKKSMGAIRSSISNANKMAQSLLLKAMKDPSYLAQKERTFETLKRRYEKVREVIAAKEGTTTPLTPLPFNSGYFMTFLYDGDAEKLRLHLLDEYGIGTISIQNTYLRIAFSSVALENIEELYETVYKAAQEVK
ncbi:MAG: aminotransferase class I/II-fold pyridoxal phosphate-dependent enzyme [Spirochaetaceae bacterium]